MPSSNEIIIVSSAVFVVSIIFVVMGVKFLNQAKYMSKFGVKTTGKIVNGAVAMSMISHKSSSYKVVEFTSSDNVTVTFSGKIGLSPTGDKHIGDAIGVMYDPKNPNNAVIDSYAERNMPWIVLLAIGGGLLVESISGWVYILFFA